MIKIKKIPFEILLFIGIVFCIEHFLYLIDESSFKLAGLVSLDDFSIILYILFTFIVYIKYARFKKVKYRLKWIMLVPIILAITSSYMGVKIYNQPFILGFRPQRFFIITYLLYFPLKRMIDCNKSNFIYIKNALIGIGFIELILYTMQYFLINNVIFLAMRKSMRFGEIRLAFESFLLLILPFILISEIFNKKSIKLNYFLLGLNLFYIVFIIKTRMILIGMILTLALLVFIYKKGIKKMGVIIILLFTFMLALSTPVGQSYMNSLSSEYRAKDANSQIRLEAQSFYFSETSKTPLLGRGFVNTLFNDAVVISGYSKGFYFNDNGLIGFYYLYGILGLIWVFSIFIKLFINAYYLKKEKKYLYWGYAINCLIIGITFFAWYFQQGAFYLVIILTLMEKEGEIK